MEGLSFLTEKSVIQAGAIVAVIVLAIAIVLIVKAFISALKTIEAGDNARQAEFNKALTNHLEHTYMSDMAKAESDKALATALTKLTDKIENK